MALVLIGEAAKLLGVSVTTLRRWEQQGILHSTRPDGKNRYFNHEDIEKLRKSRPLTVSDVAKELKVSVSTVRSLDSKGLLIPIRNAQGRRLYTLEAVKNYIAEREGRSRLGNNALVEAEIAFSRRPRVSFIIAATVLIFMTIVTIWVGYYETKQASSTQAQVNSGAPQYRQEYNQAFQYLDAVQSH